MTDSINEKGLRHALEMTQNAVAHIVAQGRQHLPTIMMMRADGKGDVEEMTNAMAMVDTGGAWHAACAAVVREITRNALSSRKADLVVFINEFLGKQFGSEAETRAAANGRLRADDDGVVNVIVIFLYTRDGEWIVVNPIEEEDGRRAMEKGELDFSGEGRAIPLKGTGLSIHGGD